MKNEYNANNYIGITTHEELEKKKRTYIEMRDVLKMKMKFIS